MCDVTCISHFYIHLSCLYMLDRFNCYYVANALSQKTTAQLSALPLLTNESGARGWCPLTKNNEQSTGAVGWIMDWDGVFGMCVCLCVCGEVEVECAGLFSPTTPLSVIPSWLCTPRGLASEGASPSQTGTCSVMIFDKLLLFKVFDFAFTCSFLPCTCVM